MGDPIRGCKLLTIQRSGVAPYYIHDPVSLSVTPDIVSGDRHEFRSASGRLVLWDEPDVMVGVELRFSQAVLDATTVRLMCGGSVSGGVYSAPSITDQTSGKPLFEAVLYVSRYEAGITHEGAVKDYLKMTFPYCTGYAPGFTAVGRAFLVPEFSIYAEADQDVLDEYGEIGEYGEGPYSFEFIASLPS